MVFIPKAFGLGWVPPKQLPNSGIANTDLKGPKPCFSGERDQQAGKDQ